MITKKMLLNEVIIAEDDAAAGAVPLISQLSNLVSDLIRGVSGAPNKIFAWFRDHIGLSISGIKKYFVNMWSSIESSDNIFMKVIHSIGLAIGTAINYVVKLLSPLVSSVKDAMGISVPGLTGVTCGQLIVCTAILSCITFVIYKIYKKIKNRSSKKQSQPQSPQEVVKEAKEMLHDTMDAVTEGVNTFKCCDKLVESANIPSRAGIVANMVAKSGKMCCELYEGLFNKKTTTEGFNIFEGDYYDRGPARSALLHNKVFVSSALLCIAAVLGFFSCTNLVHGVTNVLNSRSFDTSKTIFNIQKVILSPRVLGAAIGAKIAHRASKQIEPTRDYREYR